MHCPSVCLYVCLCLSVCMSVYLSVCPYVCLYVPARYEICNVARPEQASIITLCLCELRTAAVLAVVVVVKATLYGFAARMNGIAISI